MNEQVDDVSLAAMRERATPNTQWAAYQNNAMDSSLRSHIQYIKFGAECVHTTRPEKMPDTAFDLGWKYVFIGIVNLETGAIEKEPA